MWHSESRVRAEGALLHLLLRLLPFLVLQTLLFLKLPSLRPLVHALIEGPRVAKLEFWRLSSLCCARLCRLWVVGLLVEKVSLVHKLSKLAIASGYRQVLSMLSSIG